MANYRARSIRRARSLTARIAGAAVIILVAFLGTLALLIDPIERGGARMLVLLFAGVIALAVLLGMAVARTHARVLADLIERGAPLQAYPRDSIAVGRAVGASDAPPLPADTEGQAAAIGTEPAHTEAAPPPAVDVHEDFWGSGSKPDVPEEAPLFWDRTSPGGDVTDPDTAALMPPLERRDAPRFDRDGRDTEGGMHASAVGLYDDDPPTEPVQTIVLPAGDPAYHAAATNGHHHNGAGRAGDVPATDGAARAVAPPPANGTAALVNDLDDIVAKLRRIAQRDTP